MASLSVVSSVETFSRPIDSSRCCMAPASMAPIGGKTPPPLALPDAFLKQLGVFPARQSAASASPVAVKLYPGSPSPERSTVLVVPDTDALNRYDHEPL